VGCGEYRGLELKGLSSKARDARTREAITEIITSAKDHGAGAIVAEQLGFEEDKTRERFGRRKAFRATISRFPTTAFRERLVPMAARAGLAVIGVGPRYTSKVGGRGWCWVLLGGPTARVAKKSHDGKGTGAKARALVDGSSASCAPWSVAAQVRSPGLRAQDRDLRAARPKAARSITPVPSAPVLAPPEAKADRGRRCGYGDGHPVAGRTQKTRNAAGQPPG
jgi:IS605 OrfB family transposase